MKHYTIVAMYPKVRDHGDLQSHLGGQILRLSHFTIVLETRALDTLRGYDIKRGDDIVVFK